MDKGKNSPLTHASIRQKFKSQFELVNYAIQMADQFIHSGRSPRVHIDNQNPAVIIIEEIEEGKDTFDDLTFVSDEVLSEQEAPIESEADNKPTEKKRARRVLANQ